MKKPNPYLLQLEEKHRIQTRKELSVQDEISNMAALIAWDNCQTEDPGAFLFEFIGQKMNIARRINDDYGPDSGPNKKFGDKELLQVKKELSERIRSLLSEEDQKIYRNLFPLLWEYWPE